jgi:hypothetical protein
MSIVKNSINAKGKINIENIAKNGNIKILPNVIKLLKISFQAILTNVNIITSPTSFFWCACVPFHNRCFSQRIFP